VILSAQSRERRQALQMVHPLQHAKLKSYQGININADKEKAD
jgi:hypothetical protein